MNPPKAIIKVTYSERIDKYIGDNSDFSRADAQKLIANHAVYIGQILVRKSNFKVDTNQIITITEVIETEIKAEPEKIDLDIIYEDNDIIVINKASGVVVHPAPGNYHGTLVSGLLYKFNQLSDLNGKSRPGTVHRLDKDTSGLLVFAKNNEAHKFLASEMQARHIKRTYLAWVEGKLPHQVMHINLPIGRDSKYRQKMIVRRDNSKQALTHIYVEKYVNGYTLIRCELETGRTHQIRVHLAHIGHPIVGDHVYGHKIDDFGQRLHAVKLVLVHPVTKKTMEFTAPLPLEFDRLTI